jgi:hypothetical protein
LGMMDSVGVKMQLL